jgi:hypothetical protein
VFSVVSVPRNYKRAQNGAQQSQKNENYIRTKEYNGVSLRKEDVMCAVVTVRLINPLPGYTIEDREDLACHSD